MAEREEDMIIGPSPNLGSLFAGLSRTIAGVQDKRREKREKIQSEANETFRTMSNFELGQNKSYQEVATKGLYGIKNDLFLKNQQLADQKITAEQYKLFKNNAEDSYRAFTNTSKNYDKIIALYDKEKAEGKTGDGSALKMQYFAQNADMNGVEYYTGLDGTGYAIKRDEKGNIIDKQNVKNLSNPSNLRAETVKLSDQVADSAKNWKGNTRVDPKTGIVTTDIAKGKEALFDSSKASLMHQLTNTPEKAYSILTDNGGGELTEYKYFQDYEGYFSEEMKQKIIQERLSEAKIAMLNGYRKKTDKKLPNGDWEYVDVPGTVMTTEQEKQFIKDQEKFLIKWRPDGSNNLVIDTDDPSWQEALQEARDMVGRAVDMTVSSKQSRGWKPGGSGSKEVKKTTSGSFNVLTNAVSSRDWGSLDPIMKDDYKVVERNGKVLVVSEKKGYKKRFSNDPNADVVAEIYNPNNLNSWAKVTSLTVDQISKNLEIQGRNNNKNNNNPTGGNVR